MCKYTLAFGTLLLLMVTTAASAAPVMQLTIEGGVNPQQLVVGEDITLSLSVSGLQPYSLFDHMDFGVSGDFFTIIPTAVDAGSAIPDPILTFAHGGQSEGSSVGTYGSGLIFPEISDGVLAVFVLRALQPGSGHLSIGVTPYIYDSSFENLQTGSFSTNFSYSISATAIPEPSTFALAAVGGSLLLIARIRHRVRVV